MTHNIVYQNLFELSPEAIVLLDEKGTVIDVNKRLSDWLGYEPEEVKGMHVLNLPYLTLKTKAVTAEKFAERLIGRPVEPYEVTFKHKNGEEVIGRVYGTLVHDDSGSKYDLVMISNVTREAQAERQLKVKLDELERMNKLMVDRELRMAELKDENALLKAKIKKLA